MDDLSKEIRETLHRPKEFSDILEEQIHHGQKEHDKSNFRLFISAFSAGLEVGFLSLIHI